MAAARNVHIAFTFTSIANEPLDLLFIVTFCLKIRLLSSYVRKLLYVGVTSSECKTKSCCVDPTQIISW
jgi:hypothetical protein